MTDEQELTALAKYCAELPSFSQTHERCRGLAQGYLAMKAERDGLKERLAEVEAERDRLANLAWWSHD